jgi:hypothetical protein
MTDWPYILSVLPRTHHHAAKGTLAKEKLEWAKFSEAMDLIFQE